MVSEDFEDRSSGWGAQADLAFEPSHAELSATGYHVDRTFATRLRLQLDETSWVDHVRGWFVGDRLLMARLMNEASWKQRSRWMYTREVQEPRLTAEYPVISEAPLEILGEIRAALAAEYGRPFNRLWMNWYRDNNDATGWHADRPANKAPDAVIAVLSLGATRRFLVKPMRGGRSTVIVVGGGDLVVMGGRCQRDYQHSVPRETAPAGPRLSLNFSVDSTRRREGN